MSKLPAISQEPLHSVDRTPDAEYPLRILRAYRQHCDCKWVVTPDHDNPVVHAMNEANDQRAEILDWAIQVLTGAMDTAPPSSRGVAGA